jgi:nitrogen regulatory protein P-II 2
MPELGHARGTGRLAGAVILFPPAKPLILTRKPEVPAMKLVIAVIQPHRLDAVREALTALGLNGMTVTEVRGYGRQKGHTEIYRGAEYTVSFIPKLKVEVALPGDRVQDAITAITRAARTGKIGDGKIFVLDLEAARRVRTGETGDSAL